MHHTFIIGERREWIALRKECRYKWLENHVIRVEVDRCSLTTGRQTRFGQLARNLRANNAIRHRVSGSIIISFPKWWNLGTNNARVEKTFDLLRLKKEDRAFIKIANENVRRGASKLREKLMERRKRERKMDGGFVEYINIISDILRPVMLYLSIEQVFHFSRSNVT